MSTWLESLYKNPHFNVLVQVPIEYIEEQVKDEKLLKLIPNRDAAIKLLLNNEILNRESQAIIEQSALLLYGLIHARFILTEKGKHAIFMKYLKNTYSPCPRSLCHGCECLPYGNSSSPGEMGMRWFCPNCGDIYLPTKVEKNAMIDGAFFGPKYIIQLINEHPDIVPKEQPEVFEPRIFGFKLYPNDPTSSDSD